MNNDTSSSSANVTNSKRRRGLGIVTPNACTECRKKRAKCDGKAPCARCSTQGVECIYEIPVRQSKENMRSEIENLRNSQKQHERLRQALMSEETSQQVLDLLRNGESIENIVERLDGTPASSVAQESDITTYSKTSDRQAISGALSSARSIESSPSSALAFSDSSAGTGAHLRGLQWQQSWAENNSLRLQEKRSDEDVMKWEPDTTKSPPLVGTWHRQSISNSTPDSTTRMARGEGQETILGRHFGAEEPGKGSGGFSPTFNQTWTSVTDNSAFVEHLMALYFCWEYPIFASLSKEHFLEDFHHGRQRHCSFLLVNALLALGCRFSAQPDARTDPNDANTAGDHFFSEALKLLKSQADRHVLTTIQALGLMSIREASCGRTTMSLFYSGQSIRLAVEMGLHLRVNDIDGKAAEDEKAVKAATFWGAFSLDQAWNLSIGRLPHFSMDTKLIPKPALIDEVESASWIPYTDDGRSPHDPDLTCFFTDHDHQPGAPLERSCTQPSNVRSVYKTFCELSQIIHKSIYTLYAPGEEATSQQIIQIYTEYLHWYEAIPTSLRLGQNFTPAVLFNHMYYHYGILQLFRPFIKLGIPSSSVSPFAITLQAADAISTLTNSYSQLYTLRRTPSFVPFIVLASSIIYLVALGSNHEYLPALRQAVADLKEMSSCHGFAISALQKLKFLAKQWNIQPDIDFDISGFKAEQGPEQELCKPKSTSLNPFSANVTVDDMQSQIHGGDNPLFWSFPLHGRPMLKVGEKDLEEAGFRIS